MIKFFLITRFNLKLFIDLKEGFDSHNSISWLNSRLDIFFKYTYPTIINQSDREISWIILFDQNTPPEFIVRFKEYDKFNLINIVLCTYSNYIERVKEYIWASTSKGDLIVSMRLDSDDGLFPFSIEFIKSKLTKLNNFPLGLNFSNGIIVNTKSGVFFKKSFKSNPFFCLVENREYLRTVYFSQHQIMEKLIPTLNVNSNLIWIQNIHSNNYGNEIKGVPLVFTKEIPDSIKSLYPKYSFVDLLWSYWFIFLKRFFLKYFKEA